MTLAWMVYCLVVSLLFGFAALAAERGLRLYRRPLRWLWVGAIAGSLTLPALTYIFPAALPTVRGPVPPAIEAIVGADGMATTPTTPGGGTSLLSVTLDGLLLAVWALTSLAVLIFLMRSYSRLRRERRVWSPAVIGASRFFVSRRLGPAVSGLFRSRIVMPAWVLDLDEELRHLIVLHEEEHLRAGDHRLVLTALAALVVVPWNLPLWWQLRRLRLALEFDCDRRVLGRGVDTRVYGELLLEVGRRSASPSFLPAAFAEPRSLLEERLRNMTERVPKDRRRKVAIAATFASSLLVLALVAPSPATGDGRPTPAGLNTQRSGEAAAPQDTTQPQFTPYTVRPELKNRQAAIAAVEEQYPDSLKSAGIGGTAEVWVFIDERGAVQEVRLKESSGNDALNQAALAAARGFEFTPARNENVVVPVWVAIPIQFSTHAGGATESAKFRLRAILRVIATIQEHQYQETGEYYQSLDAILEQLRQAREDGMRGITPNENEEVLFDAGKNGWAAVARNGGLECAMYYGEIAAPTEYAEPGKAVCK